MICVAQSTREMTVADCGQPTSGGGGALASARARVAAMAFILCAGLGDTDSARAQVAGAPVFHSLKHDPTWSVHVDYGRGARELEGSTFAGVRLSRTPNSEAEQGPLRLSLLLGRTEYEGVGSAPAVAVSVGWALRPRRLFQLEVQAGLARTESADGVARYDLPLGMALGVVAALPDLWFTAILSRNPQFWIAPRAQARLASLPDGGGTRLRGGAGLGGGMELRAQNGLGVQLVWERLAMRDAASPRWQTEGALGFSIFFAWI